MRRALAAVAGAALAVTGLQAIAVSSAHASTAPYAHLVISEVYGGDGSANAAYHHDFVELFNPTATPITFADSSLYLSYFAATSSSSTPVAIPGATIPAYTHFMVERSAAGTGTGTPANQNVPHADATIALPDIAGAGGRVYLQNTATAQTTIGDVTGNAAIIDAVSGNAANTASYEGSSMGTVGGSATTSLQRKDDAAHGYLDTNTTASDLKSAAPTPKSLSDGPLSVSGGPSTPVVATIGNQVWTIDTAITEITPSASNGTAPYTFDVTGLPAGVTFASGTIAGTPTVATSGQAIVEATDGAGQRGQTTFNWTVGQPVNTANHVVISEIWGDGGYTDAPFSNDYIELYNPTAAPVDLTGWAIAYGGYRRSAGAVPTYPLTVTGSETIQPGGHYLIQGQSDANGGGVSLPDADATVDIDYTTFDYRDGFVALLDTTTAPNLPVGDINAEAAAQHVVDAVGYGPANTFEGTAQTTMTGNEISVSREPVANDRDDNGIDFVFGELSPTNSAGVVGDDGRVVLPTTCDTTQPTSPNPSIAQVQGTSSISPYINCTVTTTGVVTAIYSTGFDTSGRPTCGSCGFYLQTPGVDATPGASDAIFVSAGSTFTTPTVAIGDAVRVTGKVGEFGSGETLTQISATGAAITVTTPQAGGVVRQGSAPTTYAAREAHEGELFQPTDVVVTDTYNLESQGEIGLAAGAPTGPVAAAIGNLAAAPLQQPGQICRDGDSPCLQAAQADLKNRGYFLTGGTTYLGSSNIYKPNKSKNSDLPYPFIDKTHSTRVGANVTFPQGAVLDFRNKKWFLNPPRSVVATGCSTNPPHTDCAVDRGEDVVTFEDTRAENVAPRPAPAGSTIRFATYNVENFFSVTMDEFAQKNPLYDCEYDADRDGNGILSYQCTNPSGMATAWDPVTGAVTAYGSALANAPRGAGRPQDLSRQTSKIVTAINTLGADVVALEEIGNPNKLKLGVTNDPLRPDLANTKDQGQGTAIEWRDATVSYLVDHLNAALPPGADQWAFTASPEESTDATSVPGLCATVQPNGKAVPGPANLAGTCSYSSGQDVIRSAFLYKKAKVVPVGTGDLDLPGYSVNGTPDPWGNHVFKDADGKPTASPFDNAREPFAQYFKPVGAANNEGFALIVNHFKSKGDAAAPAGPAKGGDKNDPLHGAFNASRVAQAKELVRFANEFAARWKTDKVFMLGDYNAYSGEDPVHAITDATDQEDPLGFEEIHSDDPRDTSYVFTTKVNGLGYGGAGSLDHIFASAGARATDPRTDIWEINANEPDVYDYGRYHTNATDFWDGNSPWRGSDHNPEVVDLTLPSASAAAKVTDVQIVGINDFHGRLIQDASDGGAAPLAGAIKTLRGIYGADRTVVASAGDNVGASIFESFTQEDKPTLDALNEMKLQVSSVGNHEFDRGVSDLLNRIEKPRSDSNPYGADDPLSWGDYLAANVVWASSENGHAAGTPISDPTKVISVENPLNPGHPIKIGFVGTVTSDLPSLQSPENLAGVTVLDNAATIAKVNSYAAGLKAQGANLVILLAHEGAASTDCASMPTAGTAFSRIINGVDADVDAILSGHTHLEYSCSFPKEATASNPLTTRPVMQGASYGTALDQLVYSFDAGNKPVDLIANNVGVKGPVGALFTYGADADVQPIVDEAIADSAVAGAKVLGKMTGPMYRSKLADSTDNRGGESVLGNQVAEIQRWATEGAQQGSAQIAFMNPGGLRADALGTQAGDAYDLTYREAADVQPFANELVNMKLTGAQIKKVLEEQWQRDATGNIPARPFLKLGISRGFTYTYTERQDPAKPAGALLGTVTGMWLKGVPIDLGATYSVTVNSFLATGGDNFWELDNGADKLDTEQTDLQGQVDYMRQYGTTPLAVDSSQRGVRVTFPAGAPATYQGGDTVTFDLASLDMNAPGAVQDDAVRVKLGETALPGSFSVTHGNSTTDPDDRYGTATVTVTLPAGAQGLLRVVGATTGTEVLVPLPGLPLPDAPMTAGTPTISDTTPTVGDLLSVTPGTWTPADATFSYQWSVGGTAVTGAAGTTATYTVGAADAGKTITVAVTGAKGGFVSATGTSAATAAVAKASLTPATPTIGGTAKVGSTLTASAGLWGPPPVTLTYVWKANGAVIASATSPTYVVRAADAGKVITVAITGEKEGYVTETRESAATAKVVKPATTTPQPPVGTRGNPAAIAGAKVPAKIRARATRFAVTFSAAGASSRVVNGKVRVYNGKKRIGTFTVKNGKVVIKLKKRLTKGKHRIRFVLGASPTSKATTITRTVKVT